MNDLYLRESLTKFKCSDFFLKSKLYRVEKA